MITYVDTSVLVKLLIDEPGTPEAGQLWDQADVLTIARIGHVEARAALAAANRQSRIATGTLETAEQNLTVLWSQVAVVEIDDDVMRRAGDLAVAHSLRGYDAVHLAAALAVGADLFATADRALCAAAAAEGLHVANPVDAGVLPTESSGPTAAASD